MYMKKHLPTTARKPAGEKKKERKRRKHINRPIYVTALLYISSKWRENNNKKSKREAERISMFVVAQRWNRNKKEGRKEDYEDAARDGAVAAIVCVKRRGGACSS